MGWTGRARSRQTGRPAARPRGYVRMAPKPGVVPLHPLTLGDIISGVFATLKRYFLPVYAPLFVIAGVSAVLMGVLGAVAYAPVHTVVTQARDLPDYTPSDGLITQLVVLGGLALLVAVLCLFACYVVGSTASTGVLRHAVLGAPVTVRQAWSEARPHLGRVAWVALLLMAGTVLGVALALGIAIAVGLSTNGPAGLLIGLLVIPLAGFAVYVQVRLVLVTPVLVLEQDRALAALRRAWRLNQGAWWRSLGIPYLVNLIGSLVSQVVFVPISAVGGGVLGLTVPTDTSDGDPNFPLGSLLVFGLLTWVAVAIVLVLTLPLTPLTNGLLYIDRRIRRESLDVALAAQAAAYHGTPAAARPSAVDLDKAPAPDRTDGDRQPPA